MYLKDLNSQRVLSRLESIISDGKLLLDTIEKKKKGGATLLKFDLNSNIESFF